MKRNIGIDLTVNEPARVKPGVIVGRVLGKHRSPPDGQDEATTNLLEQAELLSVAWAEAN